MSRRASWRNFVEQDYEHSCRTVDEDSLSAYLGVCKKQWDLGIDPKIQ